MLFKCHYEERDQGVARRRGRLPHQRQTMFAGWKELAPRGDNGGLGYPCRPRRAMAISGVVHELGAGPGCGGGGASGSGGFFTLRSSR